MPRLVLDLPATLPFATDIDVRVTDLNYGGHVGNDSMLSLVHEARYRFLRHHGLSERDVEGSQVILADAALVYRAEVFAGDRLRFEVGVGDVARVGCDFLYRAVRTADARLVLEAKTGVVFLDPVRRRPVSVPAAVQQLRA